MADTDVQTPETVTPEAPKNTAIPEAPDKGNATDPSEVERLRKEAEQAKMEANMLRNKLKAEEDAKAAAKAKELEEQNQFKTLYEQEKTRREEIERQREAEERAKSLSDAKAKVLADYPDEVKAIAEDTGLDLSDDSEEAQTQFKGKLDKIQTRLGVQRVTANNPGTTSAKKEYTREELRQILADPVKRDAYYRSKGGAAVANMTSQS